MARKNKGYSKRRKPYDAYKDWIKKLFIEVELKLKNNYETLDWTR